MSALPASSDSQLYSRVLQGFLRGQQSTDNTVLTAITVRTVSFSVMTILSLTQLWIGTQRGGPHGTKPEISLQRPIVLYG